MRWRECSNTTKTLGRLSAYASLQADQDTRDSAHHGMDQEMTQVWSSFERETSYLDPEILAIPSAALRRFQAAEPRLKPYAVYLGNLTRRAAHTLSESEEKILATNEALMKEYMLTQVKASDARLSILGNYLEVLKANVFRQTQFADFELQMHQMAQRGEPVNGDALAKLYLAITRKYYGHDQGVCIVDDYVAHEWSSVPHFYNPFYVYQYATSFTASTALAQKVLAGGTAGADATKRYLAFLGSGGSKDPIDLLKDAGVDMTTSEPLDLTMREMNRVMDEMERLLPAR